MLKFGLPQPPSRSAVLEFIDAVAEVVATALVEDHNRRLAAARDIVMEPSMRPAKQKKPKRNRKQEL